jgi:hypothetical protein
MERMDRDRREDQECTERATAQVELAASHSVPRQNFVVPVQQVLEPFNHNFHR